jgi:hypothetical protein
MFWNRSCIPTPFFSYSEAHNKQGHGRDLGSRESLEENILQGDAILSKLLDTFVKLVKGHLIFKELPAEFGFIVNKRNFRDWFCLSGSFGAELPGDWSITLL